MGAFVDLFGKIPKVAVLEAFAESLDDSLSAPEVEEATGISRRAAYLIIRRYVREGVLVADDTTRGRAQQYRLNPADVRGRSLGLLDHLLTLGSLESQLKVQAGIAPGEALPSSILSGSLAPSAASRLTLESGLTFRTAPRMTLLSPSPVEPSLGLVADSTSMHPGLSVGEVPYANQVRGSVEQADFSRPITGA